MVMVGTTNPLTLPPICSQSCFSLFAMISSPLVVAAPTLGGSPSVQGPTIHRLPQAPGLRSRRWSYGRSYVIVALLAPVVLASLGLVFLHHRLKLTLILARLPFSRQGRSPV